MSLLPVKNKLYDILRLEPDEAGPDIVSEQSLGVNITKAIARDKPIIIFQQKNVYIQQINTMVIEAIKMIDELERGGPIDVTPTEVTTPELPGEGEDAFRCLSKFCSLCLKRKVMWTEYKQVVHEAYIRMVIRHSDTWQQAADVLRVQRTYVMKLAQKLGVMDKPKGKEDPT